MVKLELSPRSGGGGAVLGAIGTKDPGAAFETIGVGVEIKTTGVLVAVAIAMGVLVGVSLTTGGELTSGDVKSEPKSGNATVGMAVGVEF